MRFRVCDAEAGVHRYDCMRDFNSGMHHISERLAMVVQVGELRFSIVPAELASMDTDGAPFIVTVCRQARTPRFGPLLCLYTIITT